MTNKNEAYLGDGLYASIEHGLITLRAPREDGDHWVALDSETLAAFLSFLKAKGIRVSDFP